MTTTTASYARLRPVALAEAAAIERAEARAWGDLVAAAPADHARAIGLTAHRAGDVLVLRCGGGGFDRGLFNRPIGLGVVAPATRDEVRDLAAWYRGAGIQRFMLVLQEHALPQEIAGWVRDEGLRPNGAWDRVLRDASPLGPAGDPGRRIEVLPVAEVGADAWAGFLAAVYQVDAGPWLLGLAQRPGWHHRVAIEGGAIVGARSMYLPEGGELAFLAVDGPVPGVMTADHVPDAAICRALVEHGLALGARGFFADIEAPSPAREGPAYEAFGRLGFTVPYTRIHHMPA